MSGSKNKSQDDSDWTNRTLCSDESCIGVVGPDGRCKECGLPYEGFIPRTAGTGEMDAPREDDPETGVPDEDEPDTDWENRILCMDESCIGVVGPDGRCKECGLPYEKE